MANPITKIILTAVDKTKAAFASVKGGLSSLASSANQMAGLLGSIFTGLSVVGFAGKIKQAVDAMDEARKSAQAAGTSVKNFSALSYAGSQSGVDDMTKGLIALADSLDMARSGTGRAADAFRALRIDPAQFTDSSDALDALADSFASMPDGVEKTGLAVSLFGKRIGPQMIPLLNQGRAGIQALKDEAESLGIVIGDDAAAAAEKFNDAMDKLRKSTDGLGIKLANEMVPGMNQIVDAMNEAAKEGNILKTLWVGLGGLGAAVFTDDLLTNVQKLAKAQDTYNRLMEKGFDVSHDYVRQIRAEILVLQNKVAAEEKAAAAADKADREKTRQTQNRKADADELKKETDERIKDAERLQAALQTAFSASIRAEEDYLRQAKKLRAEANGTDVVAGDPESQALANLDAIAAVMKLQRTAGSESLENVQDQAQALRDLAGQLDDVEKKQFFLRQANLAEATALEKAAAEEKARYTELNKQRDESIRQAETMQEALANVGKEVSVEVKPGPQMEKTKQDLREIAHLLEVIKQNGPLPVYGGLDSTRLSAGLASLQTEALKYGARR